VYVCMYVCVSVWCEWVCVYAYVYVYVCGATSGMRRVVGVCVWGY